MRNFHNRNHIKREVFAMKKKALLISILLIPFLITGVVIFDHQPAYGKAKTLRLVVPSPPGDWPLTFVNEELAKKFNERAKGEYVMEVHAGGALAKLPEYFDAVRIGAVELACAPWGMFSFLDPRLGIKETPFLFTTSQGVSSACKPLLPLYDQILQEKFNAKALSMMNTGGLQLFSTKPVRTLEDWKGLLTGALSPPVAAMIKELGGSPVTIMWTDMYESLQKKVIDATTQGTHGGLVMGMTDVCKHVTLFFGAALWNGFQINLDIWKKMPKNIQQILQEEAIAVAEFMNKTVETKLGDDDVKAFKENGVDVYILPKEERDRWVEKLAPHRDKQIESLGEFGQKVKKIVDEANARYPYTERGMY
jgi:TRAP-type C4-dicarboxylate transport system substrate-binding protein